MGAAVIAGTAAVKSGIGKLFVHVPESAVDILQISLPEALLDIDPHNLHFSSLEYPENYTQIAIGSGIGTIANTQLALRSLLKTYKRPLIFDADAINILAENPDWQESITADSIFTPHPKETDRILGESADGYERLAKIKDFAKNYKVYIVLKGAHSAIACPNGKVYFNSTGNPGMATAGSGDALTGLLLSLRCQGYSALESVLVGVYLHGLAGDYAAKVRSQLSVSARDIIEFFSAAFKHLL
jgi:NAD(P)H-hydrate epimerase